MVRVVAAAVVGVFGSLMHGAFAQSVTPAWRPNFDPLGVVCWKDAKNPNVPPSQEHAFRLAGGCGCENTQFRWTDGKLYIMESHAHGCDAVFASIGYNTSILGDCSYFRIRDFSTGVVLANVSQSLGHAFFSATVDYARGKLWVFGPAHARGNDIAPGPCDGNGNWSGCYIGAWSSTDLVTWGHEKAVAKAVPLPDHHAAFNTRTTMVTGDANAGLRDALPKHQAAMVLEPRSDHAFMNGSFRYAINTGDDGDLSTNWQLLPASAFSESGPGVPMHLNMGAPTTHFDSDEGYYYTIGGGSITAGPVRSRTLKAGSWEISPLAPMVPPAAETHRVGLPAVDASVYKRFYTEVWARETPKDASTIAAFIANLSAWNWGVTDPDLCCSDDKAPSYMLHTMSQQGGSSKIHGKPYAFAGYVQYNGTLNEWLSSYFPKPSDPVVATAW